MRPLSILTGTIAGAGVLVALFQVLGPEARPAAASEAPVVLAQDLPCYLRGAREEAAQRPSPPGETVLTLGGQAGKLCYGRPSANNRTVMGELVPFGEPWRMGANEATALHLSFPATLGGIHLGPGSYSIFAIPGPEEWEIVVNVSAERWGVPINAEIREGDVGSFTVPVQGTDRRVEQLTFTWEATGEDAGRILMEWENTRIEMALSRAGA